MELHNDGSGLGFGIVGGRNTGVIVKTILHGGIADRVGIVCVCGMLGIHSNMKARGSQSLI